MSGDKQGKVGKETWTADEVSILRLAVEQKMTDLQIGKGLGKTRRAVAAKRIRLGIIVGQTYYRRPVPADFIERNATMGEMALRAHYGCGGERHGSLANNRNCPYMEEAEGLWNQARL